MGSNEQGFLNQTFAADYTPKTVMIIYTKRQVRGIVNVNCKHDDDVISMVNVDPN